MRALLTFAFGILFSISLIAQSSAQHWAVQKQIEADYAQLFIDKDVMQDALAESDRFEYNAQKRKAGINLSLPNVDGSEEAYEVYRTQVMHPELEKKFPAIKTYIGLSQDTPGKQIRFSISHKRFEGMVLSPQESTVYISHESENIYSIYTKTNFLQRKAAPEFTCGVDGSSSIISDKPSSSSSKFAGDCNLRTYRLALACTGEYAQFHGGNVPDVMEEFVVSMVRVNGIYETDLGITMVLIPNNDELIFLNSNTDPYTNNNGGTMLGQNQSTIDDIIGLANYDIGHVYSTGGGGIANLEAPCNPNRKARGVTGLGVPTGDPFWVDYVSHEMGHQFGGNHTQNNECARHQPTAMEPGSASTIMGYAGICSPNVQNNSDDHFHAISIQEITAYTTQGLGNQCPVNSDTGNNPPFVQPQPGVYRLPVDTPFRLIADASDPDENDVLTYCWEQMNNEVATMPPNPLSNNGPAFRSNSPSLSPIRYFPNIQTVVNNGTSTWEVIPSVTRNMNFRCTVRDNQPLNGCTTETDIALTFHDVAGPFRVTSQNQTEEWFSFSTQTITWDVAGTDIAPVETPFVDILLSTDRGLTYPYMLAQGIPNNGEAVITVPNVESEQARVMVAGFDNVFFDINNRDINIVKTSFTLVTDPSLIVSCDSDIETLTINYEEFEAFEEVVNLSVDGLPENVTADFTQDIVEENVTVLMTLEGLQDVEPGNYVFDIIGTSENQTFIVEVGLTVLTSDLSSAALISPEDGERGIGVRPAFEWQASSNVQTYEIELSTNLAFDEGLIIESNIEPGDIISTELVPNTVYYWRIYAENSCASERSVSTVYSFQTGKEDCDVIPGLIQPQTISADAINTVRSLTSVNADVSISKLKVRTLVEHTLVGDLTFRLESPTGLKIDLMNRPGVPESVLGCLGSNMDVGFSDDADNTAEDFENACDSGAFAITGEYQPINPLSTYIGQSSKGIWFFEIQDFKAGNGGQMTSWELEICSLSTPDESLTVETDTFYVNKGAALPITNEKIFTADVDPSMMRYTVTQLPEFGTLDLMDENGVVTTLELGSLFTQDDIDANRLAFQSFDIETDDSFNFNALSSEDVWLANNILPIRIYGPSSVDNEIDDLDLIISPNPGSGVFHFYFNTDRSQEMNLHVYSIQGKLLMSDHIQINDGSTHRIDMSELSAGIYFVAVENEAGARNTYRLIKQ